MSLTTILAEDRRLVVLRTLSEIPGWTLNESVLRTGLHAIGHPEATKDLVRADIQWLESHGLVRSEKMKVESGDLWLVALLEPGSDVAEGRAFHEGIKRRTPGN